jgi:hypothetical protein
MTPILKNLEVLLLLLIIYLGPIAILGILALLLVSIIVGFRKIYSKSSEQPLKRILIWGAGISASTGVILFVVLFPLVIIGGGGDNGVFFRPFITFDKGCFLVSLLLFAIAALPNKYFQLLTRETPSKTIEKKSEE